MSAILRLAAKLNRHWVPPHFRLVDGKRVKVDGYWREGAIRDLASANAYMAEQLGIDQPSLNKHPATPWKDPDFGRQSFEAWERSKYVKDAAGGVFDPVFDAVDIYADAGHKYINPHLRGEDQPDFTGILNTKLGAALRYEDTSYKVDDVVANIDKAIENAPGLPEDIELTRGYKGDQELYEAIQTHGRALVSRELTDKGFMSTSVSSEIGEDFGRGSAGQFPIVVHIAAKKDQKGIFIGGPEAEWLLPRNSKFRVTAVLAPDDEYDENATAHLWVELVND